MNTQQEIPDELNEKFLFNMTHTQLLLRIVSGEIDAKELAIKQLKNRGLDIETGAWVGFKQ